MPNGTAVSASAALWIVSPSGATEPDRATMTAWTTVVAPRTASKIHSMRIPSLDRGFHRRVGLVARLVTVRGHEMREPVPQPPDTRTFQAVLMPRAVAPTVPLAVVVVVMALVVLFDLYDGPRWHRDSLAATAVVPPVTRCDPVANTGRTTAVSWSRKKNPSQVAQ